MHLRPSLLVLILAIVAASSPAHAQSASTQAQSLFDEGRRLMKAGKTAEACAAFDSSQKLDPAVTTLLNLAGCREANHQLATAWGQFSDANRLARTAGNDKLAKVATNHAKKLEPRLSKLTIAVPADRVVPGLVITRGNDPVDPASFNHALPIDGGTYTITAKAPGRLPWTTTKTIKVEGDAQTVEMPALVLAPVVHTEPKTAAVPPPHAPPATASTTSTASTSSTTVVAHDAPRHSNLVPLALGAGAVVLGGAALGFHLSGNSQYDKAKQEMADQAHRDSLESSANTRRYVAETLAVAALGTASVAVYLYIRHRGEQAPATTALSPIASPGLAGLALTGAW
jgi:hypothetical protein